MGPEEVSRLMAHNKDISGFAAAFRRELFRPSKGGGRLNGDLGLRATERGGAGDSTAFLVRDYNLDSRQAGMGDVDYRGEAGRRSPLSESPSELFLNLLGEERISLGIARGPRLHPGRGTVGLRRSRSPLAPHGSRSPFAPHRRRSPLAPQRSRSPFAPAPPRSRSPFAPAPPRSRSPFAPAPPRSRSPFAPAPHRSRSPFAPAPHRSRSPFAPHRSRSPFAPHRSRSPFAPHRSRSPFAPHRSRSPFAPHRRRSPFVPHGMESPRPSLSRRRPRSAQRTARRSRSRSRERGGQELRPGLQKWHQLKKCYCIKVCNVPPHTAYGAIWSRFKPFVIVAYVEMSSEDGSALVYLEKLEDREKALASAERILDEGMTMIPWEGGSTSLPPDPIDTAHPKASRTLLVSHLDKSVSRKDLRNNFQRFGRIVDVEIKRIPRAKHYYALMQFFTVNSVCGAIKRMDGADMGGSRVHLSFGVTPESKCICVRGLTRGLSSDYIMQRFTRFGQVNKVAYNPLSCMALVLFKTIAQASQAIHHVQKNPSENIIVDYADDNYQLLFCRTMQTMGLDSGDFLFL